MKVVLALFFLVAASSAAEIYEVRLLGNHLEDLITEALEYVRSLMKKHDPYTLPSMPDQRLVDTDIDLVFSGSDVTVSKSTDFTIDSIKVDTLTLKSSFKVTVPVNHQEGNYKVSGTAWGKKVEGSGTFTLDVTNFVQGGNVQLAVEDHSIQIKDLSLDFSLGDFKINVEGLAVEGLTKDQINDLLNKQFLKYLNDQKAFVEEHTATHVKSIVNKQLAGHTLADVIDWLEKLVASTPDPPPFPTFMP
ncbi:uncharacterized protein [Halyomorpha halys]|uniref:uncharacterized protein n=1 Tax=Halyomorpha halys TaxID=286706 RepID=UPI0006D50BCD|nr:uncharacterized protein LOC106689931 [Halyomorpha halys]